MLHVGITGGIASGKTTVDNLFCEKGAILIDHDLLTRHVQEPDAEAWQQIVAHFGTGILRADRQIDREKLGQIVFSDERERLILNDIVHPAVFRLWKKQLDEIERRQPDAVVLSDIPLLIETESTGLVDLVILVFVPSEIQLDRLMTRNGLSREDAEKRIASQMPIADKRPYADFIIDNSGTMEETRRSVDAVWEKLLILQQDKVKKSK